MKIIILTILSFSFASSIVHAKCNKNLNNIQTIINLSNFNLQDNNFDDASNQYNLARSEMVKLESEECRGFHASSRLESLRLQVATAGRKIENTRNRLKVKPVNSQ